MKPTSLLGSRSRRLLLGGLLLVGAGTIVGIIQAIGLVHAATPVLSPAETVSATAALPPDTAAPTAPTAPTAPNQPGTQVNLAQPVVVHLGLPSGETITSTISAAQLTAAVSVTDTGTAIDAQLLAHAVDAAIFQLVRPAADARFRIVNDSVTVVPARAGYQVTPQSLADDVASVLADSGAARSVQLHPAVIMPAFTTADANALGIHELVSSYRQDFPAAAYRATNIGRAARYISGTILRPGQVFSMNDTIKERTPENGYTAGWIIGPNGVFVMEQGGAVSTMTTAMYNAAWFAGMKFIEHRAHSIYISRYPAGREATVSWGSFDMRFENNLGRAVFITTKLHPSSVEVFIWGSRQWDSIGTVFGPWTDKQPYPTIRSSAPDCHEQEGMIGFRITTWRTFTRAGVEVKREAHQTSYSPSPRVICVPAPPRSSSPSATAAPGPTASVVPTVVPTDTPTA